MISQRLLQILLLMRQPRMVRYRDLKTRQRVDKSEHSDVLRSEGQQGSGDLQGHMGAGMSAHPRSMS